MVMVLAPPGLGGSLTTVGTRRGFGTESGMGGQGIAIRLPSVTCVPCGTQTGSPGAIRTPLT